MATLIRSANRRPLLNAQEMARPWVLTFKSARCRTQAMADAPEPPPDGERGSVEAAPLLRDTEELRSRLARARADYDNLQRRVAREAAVERERNKARVLDGFLPLLELAHMAAHQAQMHPGPVSEGVILLAREFDRLIEREGVERTGTVGERVDAARHEVVAAEAADGVAPGCVSRVIQPGYLLGDKVLRFAKVCVAAPGESGGMPT